LSKQMDRLEKLLFKKSKPVLRPLAPMTEDDFGDVPYLWDAYKKNLLGEVPENMSMEEFIEWAKGIFIQIPKMWIVEDTVYGKLQPVAIVFSTYNGWTLEPHVVYFDKATPRAIIRAYVAFLKKTKYDKSIGACIIRVDKKNRALPNRLEKMGLIEWVGKIWGGKPDGNEYLYSMRCAARRSPNG